ncbi:MAG TPA: helix-turn-helix domain-containing protein [Puia sp.]|uniref:helix-turn-helix domain-containing protein n=1 Tax=Puia sp. TaxID=2045100 RepID=UPI002C92A44B|nr:helix-turn-helix domain-containing protein [Puia sp.]HVU93838.1 helix-turn-helix domain-containing protein [Puia sp.]
MEVKIMLTDVANAEFQLAVQYVNQTARPIFLTGRAGTGKTTFLKYIRENSFKKMAVVAPTGVAAINAGGVTMHSFFQLPFGPFLPRVSGGWNPEQPGFSDANTLFRNIRFNAAKRELLLELELLVIDEISMVRADTLDAVDTILRHFRQQPLLPFGGLQVLYIGDLYQLPPVVSPAEWDILKGYYASPFFFDAQVIRQAPPVYLELKKIYRQKEGRFIEILNNIRNNRASWEDLERLHDHYQPEFMTPKGENYITLTSHNAKADAINQEELSKLRGRSRAFEASVTGEFNDKAYPAEKTLTLKEGAQIMLIKNDKGEVRRYYNGKIGTIKGMAEDKLTIEFPEEPDELVLEKETWKNIRYAYNRERDEIEEEELGSFRQYPIRLAWAITIHKSQGLTFDKAIIDAGASFAPGQVYVALSRLRGLEGLVLRSRIPSTSISTDPRVVFYVEDRQAEPAAAQLEQEQIAFIGETMRKAFQWDRLVDQLQDHYTGYAHRKIPGREAAVVMARRWLDRCLAQKEVAEKFIRQLDQLMPGAQKDGYRQLSERAAAAAGYFLNQLETELIAPLQEHIGELRGKAKLRKYLQEIQALKGVVARKKQQMEDAVKIVEGLREGLDAGRLLTGLEGERKSRAEAPSEPASAAVAGRAARGDSNKLSLQWFREGRSIAEIAAQRELTVSTIESHLASFIFTGEVSVKELVDERKVEAILSVVRVLGTGSLGPIKSRLGDGYSFAEIRAVVNHFRYLSKTSLGS